VAAHIPYWDPICQGQDDHHVVYFPPVHEVQASDGVSEDAEASDGGSCVVDHCVDVFGPIKVMSDVYS